MRNCICIGRQFGSNGLKIAMAAAKKLNIPCYDKEIVLRAVADSGISEYMLIKEDEKAANQWLHAVLFEGTKKEYYGKNPNDILFEAQKQVILDLAKEEDCIFVGRCADSILRHNTDYRVRSVFIDAPMHYRIRTVMERDGIEEREAAKKIRKIDKERQNFYNFYSGNDWGKSSDYDMTLNSYLLDEDTITDLILFLYHSC